MHMDVLDRDERASGHHLVQDGDQSVDMLSVVDDFDDHRKVSGQVDDVGRMDHAAGAESGHSMENGGAGETLSTQPFEQRSIKWLMMPLFFFAEEDPDDEVFAIQNAHRCVLPSRREEPARQGQSEKSGDEATEQRDRDVREASGNPSFPEQTGGLEVEARIGRQAAHESRR